MAYSPTTVFTFSSTSYTPTTVFDFDATETVAITNIVTGTGFTSFGVVTAIAEDYVPVRGRGFTAKSRIYGGAIVTGRGINSDVVITALAEDTGYVTGVGFSTNFSASATTDYLGSVRGRGFSAATAVVGGALVLGKGFGTELEARGIAPTGLTVRGKGFATGFTASGAGSATATVKGRGFSAMVYRSVVSGRGFSTSLVAIGEQSFTFSAAVIMNLKTNQVSRYQNFPFSHITRLGDTYYGMGSNGIYELTGALDGEIPVNGTIWGKAHDFGVFNSKNTPYMYINGDDEYTVTAYVDSEEQPPFTSAFGGRRVRLARGNKGRYWSFKIEGIFKLQGVEFMPDNISRRVK